MSYRSVGAATKLSFDNLPEYLGMFGAQNIETNHDVMMNMTKLIEKSGKDPYRNHTRRASISPKFKFKF